jgi:hypothetical protein
MRLDIAMHNSFAVAKVECLEELEDVESDINIVELGVQASEIGVVDVLENQRWSLTLRVANDIKQGDNIGAASQVLKDLYLSLDLLLLDRLQHFDNALLIVDYIDTLKDFRVLSAANLSDDLVVFQNTPADINTVVVPVTAGHALVDIGVDTRHDGQESEGVARGGADDLERGFGGRR